MKTDIEALRNAFTSGYMACVGHTFGSRVDALDMAEGEWSKKKDAILAKGEEREDRYYSEQTMAAVVKMRDEAQERAEIAEAQLATLREALKRYGGHERGCGWFYANSWEAEGSCTCGYGDRLVFTPAAFSSPLAPASVLVAPKGDNAAVPDAPRIGRGK